MPTKIEWCEWSINPVAGCSKCSPGCDNCYAEAMARRLSKMPKTAARYAGLVDGRGRWTGKISKLDLSVSDRLPKKPCSVFVGSMTDIFHENMCYSHVSQLFERLFDFNSHEFLFLTKRPYIMANFVMKRPSFHNRNNLWFGATICNQQEADEKVPILLQIINPNHFLSIEPMLGPVDLSAWLFPPERTGTSYGGLHEEIAGSPLIDCVIVGGETGPRARPMHPDWVRSVRDQCAEAGVPFFFKGWGEWCERFEEFSGIIPPIKARSVWLEPNGAVPNEEWLSFTPAGVSMVRYGRKYTGRLLDGVEHNERPW